MALCIYVILLVIDLSTLNTKFKSFACSVKINLCPLNIFAVQLAWCSALLTRGHYRELAGCKDFASWFLWVLLADSYKIYTFFSTWLLQCLQHLSSDSCSTQKPAAFIDQQLSPYTLLEWFYNRVSPMRYIPMKNLP